jgi:hypothetical protein
MALAVDKTGWASGGRARRRMLVTHGVQWLSNHPATLPMSVLLRLRSSNWPTRKSRVASGRVESAIDSSCHGRSWLAREAVRANGYSKKVEEMGPFQYKLKLGEGYFEVPSFHPSTDYAFPTANSKMSDEEGRFRQRSCSLQNSLNHVRVLGLVGPELCSQIT